VEVLVVRVTPLLLVPLKEIMVEMEEDFSLVVVEEEPLKWVEMEKFPPEVTVETDLLAL
jgi:hypothetical protein